MNIPVGPRQSPIAPPNSANTELDALDRQGLVDEIARLRGDYKLLVDSMQDGFWDWNIPDDFEYMSPKFWEILGFDHRDKRPHPSEWQALIHPDDLPRVSATFEKHVETHGMHPYNQLVRYRHRDGHWVTVRCSGRVVEWSPEGAPLRAIGTHTDLTEVVEARTRAEIVFSGASVGVWDWPDISEDACRWSPRFLELLGYTAGALEESVTQFRELIHPDEVDAMFSRVQAHLDGQCDYLVEFRLLCKSGQYRWFESRGSGVWDADGKPTRMVGAIHDIHERKMAQEHLESLNLRHTLSLQASGIGIWDWDVKENLLVWDDQMYRLYGIREEDFESAYHAWVASLHPDDKADGDLAIQRALAGDAPFNIEFRVCRPSGEERSIRGIASVSRDASGAPLRMVGVNWDVTEQRRTEEKLRQSNDDLSRFAYIASHDLRTPIRGMDAALTWIEEDLVAGETDVSSHLGLMRGRIRRLDALVDGILQYARADAENLTETVMVADLVSVIAEDLASARPGFAVQVHGTLPVVDANPVMLGQVLANLVDNAVKHHDRDSGTIVVAGREVDGRAVLSVTDDGPGIPAEFEERIFEIFQTLESQDRGGGSGIGLALVRKIVRRYGGTIAVRPNSPRGARFEFTWPLAGKVARAV